VFFFFLDDESGLDAGFLEVGYGITAYVNLLICKLKTG